MADRTRFTGALAEPNVRAFLRVIREGESSQVESAYLTIVGGGLAASYVDHPRKLIKLERLGVSSTAAGAYQFLSRTWDECVKALDLPDFSPSSQDLAAVFLISRRGALGDVIAGRIEAAIAKCNREWASLPGSPYGQPVMTMAKALAVFAKYARAPAEDQRVTPAPIETRELPKEAPMPAPVGFLWGLASTLIDVFTPLAKEKVSKEMARHTDSPAVADRIAQGVIDTAKALTNQADPVAAVVAAKADPAIVEQIQTSVLDDLDRLAPVLDKIAQWDTQAWQSEEASRDAAAARASMAKTDQDPFLTRSIIVLLAALLAVAALLIALLAWLGKDVQTLIGFWISLAAVVGSKFGTRYDHQYGSSRSSGAKDVVMAELSRRPLQK